MTAKKAADPCKVPGGRQQRDKVTLEMVAAASGVSPSTVSRILNGTAVVSEAKRAAIDKAIAELGFVPNPIARGLAGGRTLSVGVIIHAIDSPFYGTAMRAIEDELSAAGYSPLFASGRWDTAEETRCAEMLCSRRVDGMIVLNARLSDEALRELAHRIPVVVSGRSLSGPHLYSLDFDHFEGARIAADHLLSLGHRRIAFICGDPIHADSIERLRGYRAALEASGVPYNPALVLQGDYRESSGLAATERLLDSKEPFTAIFAANDQMAFGAALALYRRGLRVPDDVSLIGIDDLPAAANAIPPLTTIHQGAYDMGRLAAASLLQLLRGAEPMGTLPPPSLVRRSSTKKFP